MIKSFHTVDPPPSSPPTDVYDDVTNWKMHLSNCHCLKYISPRICFPNYCCVSSARLEYIRLDSPNWFLTFSLQHLVGVRWLCLELPLWQIGVMLNCPESLQTSRWVDPVVATVIVARRVSKRRSSDVLEIQSRLNEASLGRDQTVSATSNSVRCIRDEYTGCFKVESNFVSMFYEEK